MARYDPRRELAPRDIVARSIDAEMKRRGDDCAFLDMTHLPKAFLLEHFPQHPRHVQGVRHRHVGAAHPGGAGRALPVRRGGDRPARRAPRCPACCAVGEVACTGLHGANRLASNSLLEGLVFGRRAALRAAALLAAAPGEPPEVPDWNPGDALAPDEGVVVTHNWDEVRRLMWNYVGIVRSMKRLERARTRLLLLRREIRDYYWQYHLTPDLVELRNLADVAMLIVECARRRNESRGLHHLLDFPQTDERLARDTVFTRGDCRLRLRTARSMPALRQPASLRSNRRPRQRRRAAGEAHPVDGVEVADAGVERAQAGVGLHALHLHRQGLRLALHHQREAPGARNAVEVVGRPVGREERDEELVVLRRLGALGGEELVALRPRQGAPGRRGGWPWPRAPRPRGRRRSRRRWPRSRRRACPSACGRRGRRPRCPGRWAAAAPGRGAASARRPCPSRRAPPAPAARTRGEPGTGEPRTGGEATGGRASPGERWARPPSRQEVLAREERVDRHARRPRWPRGRPRAGRPAPGRPPPPAAPRGTARWP